MSQEKAPIVIVHGQHKIYIKKHELLENTVAALGLGPAAPAASAAPSGTSGFTDLIVDYALRAQRLVCERSGSHHATLRDAIVFNRKVFSPSPFNKLRALNEAASFIRHSSCYSLENLITSLDAELLASLDRDSPPPHSDGETSTGSSVSVEAPTSLCTDSLVPHTNPTDHFFIGDVSFTGSQTIVAMNNHTIVDSTTLQGIARAQVCTLDAAAQCSVPSTPCCSTATQASPPSTFSATQTSSLSTCSTSAQTAVPATRCFATQTDLYGAVFSQDEVAATLAKMVEEKLALLRSKVENQVANTINSVDDLSTSITKLERSSEDQVAIAIKSVSQLESSMSRFEYKAGSVAGSPPSSCAQPRVTKVAKKRGK